MRRADSLSKSRYTLGLTCRRALWWTTHEPDAPELVPDEATQARFDEGSRVGALARGYVPGGTLIDFPYEARDEKLAVSGAGALNTTVACAIDAVAAAACAAMYALMASPLAATMCTVGTEWNSASVLVAPTGSL